MDTRWIKRYEIARTDPFSNNKGRLSSNRFDVEGLTWAEIRDIPIPEAGDGMTFGKTFEALRKTWYAYKRTRKDGLPAPDLCLRILTLQKLLGLPLSDFSSELEKYGGGDVSDGEWIDQELGNDDIQLNMQLRREEAAEESADWGLDEGEEEKDDDPW